MSNQTTKTTWTTSHCRPDNHMPTWGAAYATGALAGFAGGLGAESRDRQIADAGFAGVDAHASVALKATPGTPAWRPPIS